MKARLRYVQPGNPDEFDDQVAMGVACLYSLPGVPCLYYGTEQGLHGSGSDPAVREALWGIAPAFPRNTSFYAQIQQIVAVRNAQPATSLRAVLFPAHLGRQRELWHIALSRRNLGLVADIERSGGLDCSQHEYEPESIRGCDSGKDLDAQGDHLRVLYSNKPQPTAPAQVRTLNQVTVTEVDGTTGTGPLNTVRVTLQPMEAQILRI